MKWKKFITRLLTLLARLRLGTMTGTGERGKSGALKQRRTLLSGTQQSGLQQSLSPLTESAARSVSAPAVVSFGQRCSRPSPRWQVLSLLSSDCRASKRAIDLLVVHCTATWPSVNFTIEKLTACHKARGFGSWPGYHLYVRRDGTLYYCRPVEKAGCHVSGFNAHSLALCYEGGLAESDHRPMDTRTAEQLVVMYEVLATLQECYPEARVVGHHDLNPRKACPCYEVAPPASPKGRRLG